MSFLAETAKQPALALMAQARAKPERSNPDDIYHFPAAHISACRIGIIARGGAANTIELCQKMLQLDEQDEADEGDKNDEQKISPFFSCGRQFCQPASEYAKY